MNKSDNGDTLLTPAEAAKRLAIAPGALKPFEKDGKLKPVRTPGGHRRYSLSEVEAFRLELASSPKPEVETISDGNSASESVLVVEVVPAQLSRGIDLDQCDREIRGGWDLARTGLENLLEGLLLVAGALKRARQAHATNKDYGAWFEEQEYPFGIRYANKLRKVAEHENEARDFVEQTFAETGEIPSRTRMINAVTPPRDASGTGASGRRSSSKPRTPTAKTMTAAKLLQTMEDLFGDIAAIVDEDCDRRVRVNVLVVITDDQTREELLRTELGPATPPDLKETTGSGGRDR